MKQILSITRKELEGYFGSPLSMIFLGAFLAVVLFIFFNVEAFFARGIADVRPLFRWMPILLIFLLAALTMRQWSEEQRSGTLEVLLTLPVNLAQLVLGKFLAVMSIITIALALTLPLPIMTSNLGRLDWGPVIGGYLAALLMASSYAAIGLFISSRTDNQIVSLISTVLLGGIFYLVGTRQLTDFVGGPASEILWGIGTGSRFESIERGVIDLRDLVYYISLTGIFLLLNTISLDSIRWSLKQTAYRRKLLFTAALIGLNLVLINFWLFPLQGLRLDLTAQKEYTISQTTRDLLDNLQEPLLIRGYISEKTHPLLAPLAPRIKDTLREYEIASSGMVTAEILDPLTDPEIEAEANQTYGIRPTPFQVAGRHEASIINSYFDILVRYGDQSVVLGFQDLIEVEQHPTGVNVHLRNLEYDLTRAVKKVIFGFQSVDSVLAALDQPVHLTLFVTPDMLPPELFGAEEIVNKVATEIQNDSNGKFVFEITNPDAVDSPINRQFLTETYGLLPFPTSLFSTETYYFHMLLENGEQVQFLYPPADLTEAEVRTAIESALKRTSTGFLKVVGLWTPPETPTQDMFGQMQPPISTYQMINEQLRQEYDIHKVDLAQGQVPSDIDVLVIVAPQNFSDHELFAIDQYLMRGGSVVIANSNSKIASDQFTGGLTLQSVDNRISELLESYGIQVTGSLVMDRQNEPFPVAVTRDIGGFEVQEIQAIDYPFFVDVRSDGMDSESPIMANLPTVTMNWTSPVELDEERNVGRETSTLLSSSPYSWLRTSIDIQPDFELYPELGFAIDGEQQSYPLAVSVQGVFESYFKDKPSPFQSAEQPAEASFKAEGPPAIEEEQLKEAKSIATIEQSPETARLIVIGSATFIDDFVLRLSSRLSQDRYLNNLGFLQNTVDWSIEDLDLLTIRARGTYTRVLIPLSDRQQTFWEVLNYSMVIIVLLAIYLSWQIQKRNEQPMELLPVSKEIDD